jgi:hypothetical protein
MMEFLSAKLENALDLADADPEQAAVALREAAGFLRKGEPLPFELAIYLADAFERSMSMAPSVRGSELLINLRLKANNRRRVAVNFEYLGRDFEECLNSKMSVLEAQLHVGALYKISESTVKRLFDEYLAFKASELKEDSHLHEAEHVQLMQVSEKKLKAGTRKSSAKQVKRD